MRCTNTNTLYDIVIQSVMNVADHLATARHVNQHSFNIVVNLAFISVGDYLVTISQTFNKLKVSRRREPDDPPRIVNDVFKYCG